jgi:hypothetical protein
VQSTGLQRSNHTPLKPHAGVLLARGREGERWRERHGRTAGSWSEGGRGRRGRGRRGGAGMKVVTMMIIRKRDDVIWIRGMI